MFIIYAIPKLLFCVCLKTEKKLHEAKQKLDLLQCSLEKRMGQMSPKQASVGIYQESYLPSRSSTGSITGENVYTTLPKPAALTGKLIVSIVHKISGCSGARDTPYRHNVK